MKLINYKVKIETVLNNEKFFESYKELYGASDPLSSEGYRINFGAVNINLYIIAY